MIYNWVGTSFSDYKYTLDTRSGHILREEHGDRLPFEVLFFDGTNAKMPHVVAGDYLTVPATITLRTELYMIIRILRIVASPIRNLFPRLSGRQS